MPSRKAKQAASVSSPSLEIFKLAAAKLTHETTATPKAARDALKKQGILTPKTEKLTRRYAPVR